MVRENGSLSSHDITSGEGGSFFNSYEMALNCYYFVVADIYIEYYKTSISNFVSHVKVK
jgi:hypothetical protein